MTNTHSFTLFIWNWGNQNDNRKTNNFNHTLISIDSVSLNYSYKLFLTELFDKIHGIILFA